MMVVTHTKLVEVEETFGLVNLNVLFRGYPLMLKVRPDAPPHDVKYILIAAADFEERYLAKVRESIC